jgi:hypothetical protein
MDRIPVCSATGYLLPHRNTARPLVHTQTGHLGRPSTFHLQRANMEYLQRANMEHLPDSLDR